MMNATQALHWFRALSVEATTSALAGTLKGPYMEAFNRHWVIVDPTGLGLERRCQHCARRESEHVAGKCLYGASRYTEAD